LTFSDIFAPLQTKANSLDFATRAILFQESKADSKWHLVAFFSKSLSPVKYNYKIYDKNMLAIIYTLEEWWYFIEGAANSMEIWMNYQNLEYFIIAKKLK